MKQKLCNICLNIIKIRKELDTFIDGGNYKVIEYNNEFNKLNIYFENPYNTKYICHNCINIIRK